MESLLEDILRRLQPLISDMEWIELLTVLGKGQLKYEPRLSKMETELFHNEFLNFKKNILAKVKTPATQIVFHPKYLQPISNQQNLNFCRAILTTQIF